MRRIQTTGNTMARMYVSFQISEPSGPAHR